MVILLPLGGLCKLCCFRKLNTVTTPPKTLKKSGEYTLSKKICLLVGFFFPPACYHLEVILLSGICEMFYQKPQDSIWKKKTTTHLDFTVVSFSLEDLFYYTWFFTENIWHSNMITKILSAENMFFEVDWYVMAEKQMVILHLFWESRQQYFFTCGSR